MDGVVRSPSVLSVIVLRQDEGKEEMVGGGDGDRVGKN